MHANSHVGALQTRPDQFRSLEESQKTAIRQELKKILNSPAFHGSRRSREFLAFVVEQALEGHYDDLKERTIGIELYGRSPSYATGEDSMVRVKATEVRKRLVQYYAEHSQSSPVRIELPVGSYNPEFHFCSPDLPTPQNRPKRTGLRWWLVGLFLAGGLGLLAFMAAIHHTIVAKPVSAQPSAALDRFWAPVITSAQPVVICLASPTVYGFSNSFYASYSSHSFHRGSSILPVIRLNPSQYISARDIISVPDQYVAIGDAYAAATLSAMFTYMGKTWQLRSDPGFSFVDLRNSPAVLIGAFNNRWTLQMTSGLRVVFVDEDSRLMIRENKPSGRIWTSPMSPSGQTPFDYALISRILDSKSGQPLIAVGGITQYGTHAAGAFLTSNGAVAEILKHGPPGWQGKNLQVVIRTDVIGSTPGPAQVVATYFW